MKAAQGDILTWGLHCMNPGLLISTILHYSWQPLYVVPGTSFSPVAPFLVQYTHVFLLTNINLSNESTQTGFELPQTIIQVHIETELVDVWDTQCKIPKESRILTTARANVAPRHIS